MPTARGRQSQRRRLGELGVEMAKWMEDAHAVQPRRGERSSKL
uniref:Uncharacterized protein n=1 Tax=Arundo donax TaxID=35708 RepID=A0A0A8ZD33_ARUDO